MCSRGYTSCSYLDKYGYLNGLLSEKLLERADLGYVLLEYILLEDVLCVELFPRPQIHLQRKHGKYFYLI